MEGLRVMEGKRDRQIQRDRQEGLGLRQSGVDGDAVLIQGLV